MKSLGSVEWSPRTIPSQGEEEPHIINLSFRLRPIRVTDTGSLVTRGCRKISSLVGQNGSELQQKENPWGHRHCKDTEMIR